MTGAVLIAVYLLALAWFLGMDVVRKVPPTLHRAMAASIGGAAGFAAAVAFAADAAGRGGAGATLVWIAVAVGAAGIVAGLHRARLALAETGRRKPTQGPSR
jgi:H+-translocating NAD(P) transhydrogenase subunit alpha